MNWKCHHGFLFFLPYLCCRLLYKNASLFSFFFFCCSRTAYMLMYRRDSEEWRPRPELSGWVDGCKEIRGHGAIKYGMHWFYGSISWEFLTFFHNVKGFIVYIFFSWSHWAQPANEFLLTSRWRWRLYTGKGFPSQTTHTVNTLTGTGGLVWSDCLAEIFAVWGNTCIEIWCAFSWYSCLWVILEEHSMHFFLIWVTQSSFILCILSI